MVRIKTILALLSVLSACMGYLPLYPYLDVVSKSFFPLAVLLGLYLDHNGSGRRGLLLTVVSLVFFIYYGSAFSLSTFVAAAANLLVSLLGVRMLSEKNGRNYLQIFALSLFCLASSSLYNLSGTFLLYLVTLLILLAVSLVFLTFHAHDAEIAFDRRGLKKVVGTALLLPSASLPIMLVLFVIMPRTQYPLWNFMSGEGSTVGFTDRVTPGSAQSVSAVSTPAFRVLCKKIPEERLYWRGIVLNGFNGDAWVRLGNPAEISVAPAGAPTVTQKIYPEPSRTAYLPALNVPISLTGVRHASAPDFVNVAGQPTGRRMAYEAVSVLSSFVRSKGEIDRAMYLALPEHLPPRLASKAREIAAAGNPEREIDLLERFFRAQKISYATSGLPQGTDPLDQFLFGKKKGNCEFFASSTALMLRVAGIPARLVGGYHGGIYSDGGGYYLVTDDMAHVWVEAYLPGKGWITVDPSGWALNFGGSRPKVSSLRLFLDSFGFYWNKAVVTYDLDKQISLLQGAGRRLGDFRVPHPEPRRLLPLILVVLAAGALYGLVNFTPASVSQRLLRRFMQAVHRRYPQLETANLGIFELARNTEDPLLKEFVSLYGGALYRDRTLTSSDLMRLNEIVRALDRDHAGQPVATHVEEP